jgi:tRNA (guanine26-N2/guanine27-N2)-dimethyltransferase
MMEQFTEIIEGKIRLVVPIASISKKVPPKIPAFFNTSARLNRDISVIAYNAFLTELKKNKRTFADSLSGIGARALRVAAEVPGIEQVYINDINVVAIEAAKKAARLNFIEEKCSFSVDEVCKFLISHSSQEEKEARFAIVDLDPFGSPSQYVDCLLRSVSDNGLISLTATDTAVLCGVYPNVCLRKYFGRPIKTHYANEIALRLLLSLVAFTAARLGLAVTPLFAHANLHYMRVYVKVSVSNSQANKVHDNIGYVRHCHACGNRNSTKEYNRSENCQICQKRYSVGGQLWISRLFDREFVKKMIMIVTTITTTSSSTLGSQNNMNTDNNNSRFDSTGSIMTETIKKILFTCSNEVDDIPYYFRSDEIASKLKTNSMPLLEVINKLRSSGYKASRSILNPSAFKTNARIDEIQKCLV